MSVSIRVRKRAPVLTLWLRPLLFVDIFLGILLYTIGFVAACAADWKMEMIPVCGFVASCAAAFRLYVSPEDPLNTVNKYLR